MIGCKINNLKASCKITGNDVRTKLVALSKTSGKVSKRERERNGNFFVLRDKFVFTIFFTGHVNCTKLKNFQEFTEAQTILNNHLENVDISVLKTDTISANGILKGPPVNLFRLSNYFKSAAIHSHFNPEKFPGLNCRINDSSTFIVFQSGKYISVGAKTAERLTNDNEAFRKHISQFREVNDRPQSGYNY